MQFCHHAHTPIPSCFLSPMMVYVSTSTHSWSIKLLLNSQFKKKEERSYITSTKNSHGLPMAILNDCRLPDRSSGTAPTGLGIGGTSVLIVPSGFRARPSDPRMIPSGPRIIVGIWVVPSGALTTVGICGRGGGGRGRGRDWDAGGGRSPLGGGGGGILGPSLRVLPAAGLIPTWLSVSLPLPAPPELPLLGAFCFFSWLFPELLLPVNRLNTSCIY